MAPTNPGEPRKIRILVTGFEPFRDCTVNPSALIAEQVDKALISSPPDPLPSRHTPLVRRGSITSPVSKPGPFVFPAGPTSAPYEVEIHAKVIPVKYSAVLSTVPGLHAPEGENKYDAFLHLGFKLSNEFTIECQANKLGYKSEDTEKKKGPLVFVRGAGGHSDEDDGEDMRGFGGDNWAGGKDTLTTNVDTDGLEKWLKEKCGVPLLCRSYKAGRYLCEFIYYASLYCAASTKREPAPVEPAPPAPVLFVHVPNLTGGVSYTLEEAVTVTKGISWWLGGEVVSRSNRQE